MQLSLKSFVLAQVVLDLEWRRLMISASCRMGSVEDPPHFEESCLCHLE